MRLLLACDQIMGHLLWKSSRSELIAHISWSSFQQHFEWHYRLPHQFSSYLAFMRMLKLLSWHYRRIPRGGWTKKFNSRPVFITLNYAEWLVRSAREQRLRRAALHCLFYWGLVGDMESFWGGDGESFLRGQGWRECESFGGKESFGA